MACWCAWNYFKSFAFPFEYHCDAGPTLTRRWTPLLSFLLVSSPLGLRGNFLILYDLYQGSTAQSIMHVWANGHVLILRAEMCWLGLCPDNDWMFFLFTLQWPRVDVWCTHSRHSLLERHQCLICTFCFLWRRFDTSPLPSLDLKGRIVVRRHFCPVGWRRWRQGRRPLKGGKEHCL